MSIQSHALTRHLVLQVAISMVINGGLSLMFGLLVVHGRTGRPLLGPGGIAFDFYPQVFMITFATVFAVTLVH